MVSTKFFAHPSALVESAHIGQGTRVWAFAHILRGAKIGKECNICDGVFIENDVVVGDRVTIKCGVQLWDGLRLEDDVFVGPNVTFTNDPFPRSRHYPEHFPRTSIQKGASIGANATILPGVTIGRHAMVGAGAVVTRSIPPYAVVLGNPARIVRFDGAQSVPIAKDGPRTDEERESRVRYIVGAAGKGGELSEWLVSELPFKIAQIALAPNSSHHLVSASAAMAAQRLFVALAGAVQIYCDDGMERRTFTLDRPSMALYIPVATWCVSFAHSRDAVLLLLASEEPARAEMLSDYEEYVKAKGWA